MVMAVVTEDLEEGWAVEEMEVVVKGMVVVERVRVVEEGSVGEGVGGSTLSSRQHCSGKQSDNRRRFYLLLHKCRQCSNLKRTKPH